MDMHISKVRGSKDLEEELQLPGHSLWCKLLQGRAQI